MTYKYSIAYPDDAMRTGEVFPSEKKAIAVLLSRTKKGYILRRETKLGIHMGYRSVWVDENTPAGGYMCSSVWLPEI